MLQAPTACPPPPTTNAISGYFNSGINNTVQLKFVGADVWGDKCFDTFHN